MGIGDTYTREIIIGGNGNSIQNELLKGNKTWFKYMINPIQISYRLYPQSLLQCLSQIGGLLALFKLGIFIQMYHERKFAKQFNSTLSNGPKDNQALDTLLNQSVST